MADVKKKSDSGGKALVVLTIVGAIVWWFLPERIKVSVKYEVPEEHVFVDSKPKDCEWQHAPLGDKGCHYEKTVAPVKNNAGHVTDVYVTWQKVAD